MVVSTDWHSGDHITFAGERFRLSQSSSSGKNSIMTPDPDDLEVPRSHFPSEKGLLCGFDSGSDPGTELPRGNDQIQLQRAISRKMYRSKDYRLCSLGLTCNSELSIAAMEQRLTSFHILRYIVLL